MLLLRLWHYLRGYVIIMVEGYFVEKFVNVCTRRNILLWDVCVHQQQFFTMRMSIHDFKQIRPVARKTKCTVRILKKSGLPFILNRYRRREAFFIGALLFIGSLYVMTSFIWSIEISGNKELPNTRIEQQLQGYGIRTGILKYGIDTDRAVSRFMLDMREISWISISITGTKLKVELRERIKLPEIIPTEVPCNIVARRDGVIRQVIATSGVEAVSEADTVKAGQVLISGRIPPKDEKGIPRLVHAMGTVTARTWYEQKVPVELKRTVRFRTGNVSHLYSLRLFSRNMDLFHGNPEFTDYTASISVKRLEIAKDIVFPIEWIDRSIYEEEVTVLSIEQDEARRMAADQAYDLILKELPDGAKVMEKEVVFQEESNGQMARVTVECTEDIGLTKTIGGN